MLVRKRDRRQRAQAGMRTNVLVVVAPGLDDRARCAQADEHLFVKAFIAQPAVEALDESMLDWLAGLEVVPGHPVERPAQDRYRLI